MGWGAPAEPHPKEKTTRATPGPKETGGPRPKPPTYPKDYRWIAAINHPVAPRKPGGEGERGGREGATGGGGSFGSTWMHLHYRMCYLPLLLLLLLLLRWLLLLLQLLPSLLPRLQCLQSTGRHKLPSLRRPGRVWRLNHPTC